MCCSPVWTKVHLCTASAARSRRCCLGSRRSVSMRASLPDTPNAEPVVDISLNAARSGVPGEPRAPTCSELIECFVMSVIEGGVALSKVVH